MVPGVGSDCANPDPSCPSGYRYDPTAGSNADECVVWPDGSAPDLGMNDLADMTEAPDMTFVATDMCPGPVYCQSVTQVGGGDQFTCALLSNGSVYCWGANGFGQLGLGTGNTADKHTPQKVTIAGAVSQIAVGGSHACALMAADQSVECWGYNQSGQLGRGSKDANAHPDVQPVLGLAAKVASLAAGQYFTCAVLVTGAAQCWGANDTGQLGTGTSEVADPSPQTMCAPGTSGSPCTAASGVKEVAGGAQHSCVRFANNTIACSGFNMFGELGFDFDGSTLSYTNPKTVSGIPPAGTAPVQLSLSGHDSCARMSSGQVYCWGDNGSNQLGRGTTPGDNAIPAAVCSSETCATKLNAVALGVGAQHMCAVTAGAVSAVTCWGSNSSLQMGDGTSTPSYDVAGNQAIAVGSVAVASGAGFSCSLIATGNLKCWGDDTSGQLGDNDTKNKTPVTPLW